jgi:hypothetical protein
MVRAFKSAWKHYRKFKRRAARAPEHDLARLHRIMNVFGSRINSSFDRIKAYYQASEKPEGLEKFLEDIGL